jgi:protein TonB
MGYQALLFCPDEKTARTVTQVLSELDFSVVPCTEPFGAVKKLMGEHFDAVVVDCDNEQNATLLFKSARNAPNNHSSLAVAVVEGQAGVAKAFRIGANLVLTKPVNVEQAKGTLRVARGLLRKSEAAKPATGAPSAAAKPAAPTPSNLTPRRPISTTSTSGAAAANARSASAILPAHEPAQPRVVASVHEENIDADVDLFADGSEDTASPANVAPEVKSAASQPAILSSTGKQPSSAGGFGTGAATAPARESKLVIAPKHEPSTVDSELESPIKKVAAAESSSAVEQSGPSLTLGGAVESAGKPASGSKKVLLAVAAIVLVAALGYAVWMQWVRSSGAATPFTQVVTRPVTTAAKVPPVAPSVAPAAAPSNPSSAVGSTPNADSSIAADKIEADKVTATEEPVTKTVAKPIAVKGGNSRPAANPVAAADAPAPSLTGISPANTSAALPNLISSPGKPATPMLQVMHVSQGVSRGLLVKQVSPKYPVPALQRRVEGAVELQATISKNGDITAVKALSGDAQLAYAAVEAVKQWKYKPYLLDGEPIEIQTQVTVNFKLPH